MRVAVTGAGGFVGINVVASLLARGHDVLAIDLGAIPQAARAELNGAGSLVTAQADVLDEATLASLLGSHRCEAIFHGASVTANFETEGRAFDRVLEVNVVGTARVLGACRAAGLRRAVIASSSAVYGELPFGAAPVDEDCAPRPLALYGISKLAAEQSALRYGDLHGIEVIALRIAAVFGPWEWETGRRDVMSPLFQIARSAMSGHEVVLPPGGSRDWIDARRVADAVCLLIERSRPARRIYNIAARETWSPELLCAAFAARLPGFRSRVGTQHDATIDYRDDLGRQRRPLCTDRIVAEFGANLLGHHEADAVGFADWAIAHPRWFAETTGSQAMNLKGGRL